MDNTFGLPNRSHSSRLFKLTSGARRLHRRRGAGGKMRRLPLLLPETYLPRTKRKEIAEGIEQFRDGLYEIMRKQPCAYYVK